MNVFKRGGFIIIDENENGEESPIPVGNFDYKILTNTAKVYDLGEGVGYYDSISNIKDESGTQVGDATAVAEYFASLTASSFSSGANSPSHQLIQNPSSVSFTGFKKLSFICSGEITVTLDGNDIIYPQELDQGTMVFGEEIEADSASLNAVTFDGTGKVLLTIKQ